MNAVLREEYEAPVLTNEAIEVHLSYLRPAVDAIQAELPALRQEIRTLDEKLTGKIDAVDGRLSGKIDALDKSLNAKIDAVDERLNAKIDAVDEKLTGKIDTLGKELRGEIRTLADKLDKLAERVLEMQGNQKGLILFLTICAVLAAGISIAHDFHWM